MNTAGVAENFARKNDIGAVGQWTAHGFEGFAAHRDNLAGGAFFYPAEIFRQVPGDFALMANDAVERHGGDRFPVKAEDFFGFGGHWEYRLNGDRRFDRRVGIVSFQTEIVVAEVRYFAHIWIDVHFRQGSWLAVQLFVHLIKVVLVDVQVAEGVNKISGFEIADLCHHLGQQRVGSDIERHAEEQVGTALVELAAQAAVLGIDEKLKKGVAGGQGHLIELAGIPSADDVAATVGVVANGIDDILDLVGGLAIG